MPSLTVSYTLDVPSDTPTPPNLNKNETLQASLPDPTSVSDRKEYYEQLRKAVLQTKGALGEQLTVWRDAVGKREDKKEVVKKEDEDEEGDDDADEE